MSTGSVLRRWLRFNGVGALGVVVQVSVLGALVYGQGVHYLVATPLAVEAAVLHNFWWHERWTWHDRPSGTGGRLRQRLLRFHLLNGAISLGGNILLMRLLTGTLGIEPLAASLLAIAACSCATFLASEAYVFTRALTAALLIAALPAFGPPDGSPNGFHLHAQSASRQDPAAAGPRAGSPPVRPVAYAHGSGAAPGAAGAELQPETVRAWNTYDARVRERHDAASPGSRPFFALDVFGEQGWREAALGGGVPMVRMDRARPGDADLDVPDGKIHHWTGVIFVPGITPEAAVERVRRVAGNEAAHYDDVIGSKLLRRDGMRDVVFLQLRRTKVVTVTYNTEHAVEYRRLDPARVLLRSVATRIAELEHAGTPREQEKPPGRDSGYLWRLNAYWRYEAAGNGVLIECESVSLSRGVPALLRPFITGVVEGLARESLERTLSGLRRVLTAPMP